MALDTLAPWLSTNPQEWGNLAARGAQLDIERARLAQEAQERKAASALQRDRFQLDTQNAQTRNDQLAAGMALKLAQLKQSGLMGQEKLGQGQERIDQSGQSAAAKLAEITNRDANTNQNQQDRNQTAADALAAKTDANVPKMSFADQEKLKYLYGQLTAAQMKFDGLDDIKDHDAKLKAVGELGKIKDQIKLLTQPAAAASTLTAGTGTNPPGTPTTIPYTKGLKPVKDQLYSIKGKTYSWDGTQFIEQ